MTNYKGEDGVVSIKINGKWKEIGRCGIVTVDATDKDLEEQFEEAARAANSLIGEEFELTGMVVGAQDLDGMYEYIYYKWLARKFPTLFWN